MQINTKYDSLGFAVPAGKRVHSRCMEIAELEEVRRQRFAVLLAEFGGQERLADRLGVSQAYVSKLKNGKKPFTERTARSIEQELNKPSGWLDSLKKDALIQEVNDLLEEIAQGDREELEKMLAVIRAFAGKSRPAQ